MNQKKHDGSDLEESSVPQVEGNTDDEEKSVVGNGEDNVLGTSEEEFDGDYEGSEGGGFGTDDGEGGD